MEVGCTNKQLSNMITQQMAWSCGLCWLPLECMWQWCWSQLFGALGWQALSCKTACSCVVWMELSFANGVSKGDQDISSEMVGALLDFLEEESLPSGVVGHPRASEWPRLSPSEAASVREANDSSTDKSDLESLIQDPPGIKIRRPHLKPDCRTCDSTFSSACKLDLHIREQHLHTHSFKCEKCDGTFVTCHDLTVHNSAYHMSCLFICKWCLMTASSWYKIKQHVHIYLSKKLWCEVYGQEVSTKEALRAHTLHHMDKSWHICKFCDRKFTAVLSLITHEVGKHCEGFPCSCCDKVFTSPAQKQSIVESVSHTVLPIWHLQVMLRALCSMRVSKTLSRYAYLKETYENYA